jgi:opacity protein-like surface antigen
MAAARCRRCRSIAAPGGGAGRLPEGARRAVHVGELLPSERARRHAHLSAGRGDSNNGVLVSANALYHLDPKARTTPFLSAGAGLGTGVEYLGIASDDDTTVKALHAGVGLKTLLGSRAAFRMEYRFTHYAGGRDSSSESQTEPKLSANVHRLLMGFSVFLH